MFLPLQEKLNPYWKEEFNCSCKTRISWYPLEWRKEGRKTNKIMTERPNEARTNDWLIDVPSFVREVETLLKGGIQLLLQNKDILVPSWVNAWMKEGRKEGRKEDERDTDWRTDRAQGNEWLIVCSFCCKRSWTLTERRNSTAPAKQGHMHIGTNWMNR